MTSESISDSDLRQALINHGVEVGPITPTTRNVYRKKLAKFSSSHDNTTTTTTTTTTYREVITEPEHHETYREETDIETNRYVVTPARVVFEEPKNVTPISLANLDSSSIDSPYRYANQYFPTGDNLKRRPLHTPGGTLRSVPLTKMKPARSIDQVDGSTKPAKSTKSTFPWCRLVVILFVIAVVLIGVVYYHMEHNDVKELQNKEK